VGGGKAVAPPITRIEIDQALGDIETFDSIIDVRSPAEFADDHLPGAINLPVLNDQQRAEIGTLYKQINPFAAKRAGAALVAQNIAMHLQTALQGKGRNWRPLIYCWRGGQRSAAMAQIFANIGWHCGLVDGGYKAYRRHVLDCLDAIPPTISVVILSGQTGTAKTHILQAASRNGAQIIDLETLACHRGSLLGSEPDKPQPSQRLFESGLCQSLKNCNPQQHIFIEAESNKIGNIHVPPALWAAMRAAPSIRVTATMTARVNFLQRDYAHMIQNPEVIMPLLSKLKHRHSAAQLAAWDALIDQQNWHLFIESLLDVHYDPAYQRSSSARPANEAGVMSATTLCVADVDRLAHLLTEKSANIRNGKLKSPAANTDL
jgi:tRNA 2-selenouridine synthase